MTSSKNEEDNSSATDNIEKVSENTTKEPEFTTSTKTHYKAGTAEYMSDHNGESEAREDSDIVDENESVASDSSLKKSSKSSSDKASMFRKLLLEEARQAHRHKRLVKKAGELVESEAEEEEEDDVLKIGGLGDFGFGVPKEKNQQEIEEEEERNALKLREDDLENIVDDLSDDEKEKGKNIQI